MTLDELARLFDSDARKMSGGYMVRCPIHEDKKASLKISQGSKALVLFCHAGCQTKDILLAKGISASDLSVNGNGHKAPPAIAITYDYRDENGALVYQVIRKTGKKFSQRRPDGNGDWIYKLDGTPRTLYRLPELLAADPDDYVFIVEGEKDVDNLRAIGCVATCNSGGAGKWPANQSKYLNGRICIGIPDNDESGEKHTIDVIDSLRRFAPDATTATLRLPDLKPKGDVSDWLQNGGSASELRRLAEAALSGKSGQPPKPPKQQTTKRSGDEMRFSDYENAERLIQRHGENIRYCSTWKKWLIWQETHWQEDQTQEIVRLAKETVRHIYAEASEIEDSADRKALVSHARKSEARGRIVSMIGLAESETGIPVRPDQLDATDWLLPCPNGTVNLKTGELLEPSRAHYLTKVCSTKYIKHAAAPKWEAFLDRIFQSRQSLIQFVQRIAGYSLTGDVGERCMFILYGTGRNGKSTLLETISKVIGDAYARTTTADLLLSKQSVGDLTTAAYMASLKGYRMVSCSETEDGKRMAESAVKSMTGNESISAMHKYSDPFDYRPQFKVWLATNHKPEIRGTDEGIWDRIKLVPFQVRIPDAEVNRNLQRELMDEAEGILAWIVRGCLDWQQNGLSVPNDVTEATGAYRGEMDVFQGFVEDCLVIGEDYRCKASKLYAEYKKWCETTGEYCQKQRWFGQRLSDRGFETKKGTGGVRVWHGVDIRAELFD